VGPLLLWFALVGGEAGTPVTVESLPALRAGLEWCRETSHAKLTSTDTTERDAGMLLLLYLCPARRIAGRAGYWLWRSVALVDG
jgi:hypothetical protein